MQKMIRSASSHKKMKSKINELFEKSGGQQTTPRGKKSISHTSTNYMQLQLQTSHKKKIALEKVIEQKDKRISDLEKQIRENQQLVSETLTKWKDHKTDCDRQKLKSIRLIDELSQSKEESKLLAEKCQKLQELNANLRNQSEANKGKIQFEQRKFSQLKQKYKRLKKEARDILPMLYLQFQEMKTEHQKTKSSQKFKK